MYRYLQLSLSARVCVCVCVCVYVLSYKLYYRQTKSGDKKDKEEEKKKEENTRPYCLFAVFLTKQTSSRSLSPSPVCLPKKAKNGFFNIYLANIVNVRI